MRAVVRSIGVMLVGAATAVLLSFSGILVSGIALAATTALIMGGTFHPLGFPPDDQGFVDGYAAGANDRYMKCEVDCTLVGVVTPEAFSPIFGALTFNQSVAQGRRNLGACIEGRACTHTSTSPLSGTTTGPLPADSYLVFGYSQSATIATLEKRRLADASAPDVSFEMIGNPNRPNGGFLSRGLGGLTIPILDVTFSGPTPTDTPFETDDTTRQYDGWSDGPVNPLNILADINALMGIGLMHSDYFGPTVGQPILQDEYGDTSYYLIPANILPLLMPLHQIPGIGPFVAAVLDAPLRVLVEAGYDRTSSPGKPTGWNISYAPNSIALTVNFLRAIPTGWDDAISQTAGNPSLRPFGTEPAGPYGVGGPPVTMDPTTDERHQQLTTRADGDTREVVPQLSVTAERSRTPDADPPTARTPDAAPESSPTVTVASRPKVRNPIGADRSKLRDLGPAIKRAVSKPDKRDATDRDDTSQHDKKNGGVRPDARRVDRTPCPRQGPSRPGSYH